MQRRFQLACYVADDLGAAFAARARARRLTTAAALRQLVVADLHGGSPDTRDLRHQILFLAMAMERLFEIQGSHNLHAELVSDWRARIAEEVARHGA